MASKHCVYWLMLVPVVDGLLCSPWRRKGAVRYHGPSVRGLRRIATSVSEDSGQEGAVILTKTLVPMSASFHIGTQISITSYANMFLDFTYNAALLLQALPVSAGGDGRLTPNLHHQLQ
ncbi:hypothetical protein BC835DRAFT_686206 [Cytidiella melzeri]|nr:hypothetical protein BC835DRAFT_686206 [Cytidiella melzeri]